MVVRCEKIMQCLSGCVMLIILFSGVSSAGVPQDSHRILSLKEKDILVSAVYTYKERIHEYQEDMLRLKSDREWLDVKIKRIEDDKRPVPPTLTNAIHQIDVKLIQRDSEISRLAAITEKHLGDLRTLDARVNGANGNRAPEWWSFDEWIYHLMYPDKPMPSSTSTAPDIDTKITDSYLAQDSDLKRDLEQKIKDIELDNWVALIENERGVSLEVQLPILFGSGKSSVAKDYIPFFKKLAWLIEPYKVNVEVAGYSDGDDSAGEIPLSARMALGAERAANVVQELVETGMKPNVFKITGDDEYGSADPEKKNLSTAMKRRVEIRVYFNPDHS